LLLLLIRIINYFKVAGKRRTVYTFLPGSSS